jgi:hypothetical protein
MPKTTWLPERFALRAPYGLSAAIERAAQKRSTSPAEWARQALLGALDADGVQLEPRRNSPGCRMGRPQELTGA